MSSYERDPTTGNLSLIDGMRSLDEVKALMLDLCYPIGSMYISTVDTSPQTFLGGTWIRHEGYVLRAATSGVTANSAVKDLGNDTHTITEAEMPSHYHSVDRQVLAESNGGHTHSTGTWIWSGSVQGAHVVPQAGSDYVKAVDAAGVYPYILYWTGIPADGAHQHWISAHNTNNTGSGNAMSVVPNEKNVYMWERIA